MSALVTVTGRIFKEDGLYVAECKELGIFTCARTLDELFPSVQDLIYGHFEACEKLGTLKSTLAGLNVPNPPDRLHDLSISAVFKFEGFAVIPGQAEAEYSFRLAS